MSACAMTWEGSGGRWADGARRALPRRHRRVAARVRSRTKLTSMINHFGHDLMGRVMLWVSGMAVVLVTIWILMVGYRVVTGTLREPLMAVVTQMTRIGLIVAVATSMTIFGTPLYDFLTSSLSQEINAVVSNSDDSVATSIDKNLAYTEIAMSAIDAVQVVSDDAKGVSDQQRASDWSLFGTAGPPITAAVLLLMYQFAMALFIGLGPLFILCLIFEPTKPLFQRWLLYGIGTLFSMAVLNVVVAMVLKITLAVAAGLWTTTLLQTVFGNGVEGISHQALEQGGLGMILTLLLVTVPPMASNFFQGTLGNFMHYSAFISSGNLGPQGQPPGAYASGGGYLPPAQASAGQPTSQMGNQTGSFNIPAQVMPRNLGYATPQDIVRPANAPAPNPHLPPSPGQS